MCRTVKNILLILTITIGVLSSTLSATTSRVSAAEFECNYLLYIVNTGQVFVSDKEFHILSSTKNSTTDADYIGHLYAGNTFEVFYSISLGQWCASTAQGTGASSSSYKYILGTSTGWPTITSVFTYSMGGYKFSELDIRTNVKWNSSEIAAVKSYSTDMSELPEGITLDTIQDIIDASLNTQTEVGASATTIINNTTNVYNSYVAGDITYTEVQQTVSSNLDTLSELSQTEGATLADLMQINNAITYNQSVQDAANNAELVEHLESSSEVTTKITEYITNINNSYNSYITGDVSQADTVNAIKQEIAKLNQLIQDGTAKNSADIEAVNAAVNTASSTLDSVTGYKDLDQEVSDKSQKSDEKEMQYLDELTGETDSSIEQLSPMNEFSSSEISDAGNILSLIWENSLIQRIVPIAACFMIVCVALGIKYRL